MININEEKWINTLPVKKSYNLFTKYSLITIFFVFGLLFVSALKNEARNLQKEISILEASIKETKFNLNQSILDNEVITSPENISRLAKEHLSINLIPYKKSQIKKLESETKTLNSEKKEKVSVKKKEIPTFIKSEIEKKIKETKTELRKLQDLYRRPGEIPGEIKNQIAKKIDKKKTELKNLYDSPKKIVTLKKAQNWAGVQVVKAFLGIPVIPGK